MAFNKKLIIISMFIYSIFTCLFFVYHSPASDSFPERFAAPEAVKYILFWTERFGNKSYYFGLGREPFRNCPIKNCFTTNDKTLKSVDEFDAILFHGAEYFLPIHWKPMKRSRRQVYVFVNQESPQHFPYLYKLAKNHFYNWTMTYRKDSDIVDRYGYVVPFKTNYKLPTVEETRKKPKKVAWLASNCFTPGKREILYKKLKKYIDIDVYGKCGELNCTGRMSDECYDYLEKNYFFYLAFENSVCGDYVTEKLFNILQRNLVPVVYGGADYTADAPPYSYINAIDFPTIESLGNYLIFLINNTVDYLEYFKWKKQFAVVMNHTELAFCDLCAKLNGPIEEKIYADLDAWWSDGQCVGDFELPSIIRT